MRTPYPMLVTFSNTGNTTQLISSGWSWKITVEIRRKNLH